MKYACKKTGFSYRGSVYPVLDGQLGWYKPIMTAALNQVDALLSHTSKVFVVRFDCHMAGYSADNKVIGTFRRRLLKRLRRQYPDLLVGGSMGAGNREGKEPALSLCCIG